ncbi:hypothetical protein D3C85_1877840 [compost metagenome]
MPATNMIMRICRPNTRLKAMMKAITPAKNSTRKPRLRSRRRSREISSGMQR